MRTGDAKCVGFKDLFPSVLKLVSDYPKLKVNGIPTTGLQFRQDCIKSLITMIWQPPILTPIAMMFRYVKIFFEMQPFRFSSDYYDIDWKSKCR